ncbi:MAG TPA: DsbA family protein [Rugosimonospora sp.]|nr:DsbA family protein [Rugosimonospora sp.]
MTTPFTVAPGQLTMPVTGDDHTIGPAAAPVTVVQYGDYQCPYSRAAQPVVRELLRLRQGTVRYAYRHFPLLAVHPYAEIAAETAEAAGTRGRFWQLHDRLFEHQDALDPAQLTRGVVALALPAAEVIDEVNNHIYLSRVQRDFTSGTRSGVNGTPAFFVNGVRHDGGYGTPELVDAVDRAAEAARHAG